MKMNRYSVMRIVIIFTVVIQSAAERRARHRACLAPPFFVRPLRWCALTWGTVRPHGRGQIVWFQNTDDMEVQSDPKFNKKMTQKTDPRSGTPSAPGPPRRGTPWGGGLIFQVFEGLGDLSRFGRVLRPVLHGSWDEKVANMAPSWPPKSSQYR